MKFESDTENIIIPLIIFHSFGNCYNQFINFLPIFLFQNAHNLSIFSIYGDTSHWFLEIFRILVQIEKDTRRCFNDTLDPIATIDRSGGYTHVLVNKFMRILALCVFARGSRVINARKSVFRNGRPTVSRGAACNSGSVAVQTVLPLTIMARDRPDRYGKLLVPALIGTLADLLIRFVPPLCLPFGWRASDFAPPLWIFIRPVSLCKMPNYSIYTRWSLTRRVSCF